MGRGWGSTNPTLVNSVTVGKLPPGEAAVGLAAATMAVSAPGGRSSFRDGTPRQRTFLASRERALLDSSGTCA